MRADGYEPLVEETCAYCGRTFIPASHHALKDEYGKYCKPTCFLHRKDNRHNPCEKLVVQYNKDGNAIRQFKSATAAALFVGTDPKTISKACRTGATHGGYIWKYEKG